ncbi:MAG TPA: DUF4159 domain-containing protein [Vicinamibacterales bacterium]|nr:DUF4159 domain-containing protein [Vicinamibacterales bacterium]
MTPRRAGAVPALAGAALLLWGLAAALAPDADAQNPLQPDARFAGLQWTFARVRYQAWDVPASHGCDAYNECWSIDYPAAEHNLSRRVRTVTSIQANDPVVVALEDPALWMHPWIYIVEPGTMRLKDAEVENLREFLLRGGTLTFDDFHGPVEWAHFEREMKRVFPDRKIVELGPDHPVFSCFYEIGAYPQTPGLGSFLSGRTWEKGGFVAKLRAIEDDNGRAMVLINWNTDMGDGWEWSNAADYPGYIQFTAQAYRMQINEIIYSLTH